MELRDSILIILTFDLSRFTCLSLYLWLLLMLILCFYLVWILWLHLILILSRFGTLGKCLNMDTSPLLGN